MQDLRAVNEAAIPIHPLVPNPYTLTHVPGSAQYFCFGPHRCVFLYSPTSFLPLNWMDADILEATQYTWTVLPQGFQDSPHLLGNMLARELRKLGLEKGTLLQYVDVIY